MIHSEIRGEIPQDSKTSYLEEGDSAGVDAAKSLHVVVYPGEREGGNDGLFGDVVA